MITVDTKTGLCNVLRVDGTIAKSVNLNNDCDSIELSWTYEDGTKRHFGANFNREFLKYCRHQEQVLLLEEKIRYLESQLAAKKEGDR